MCATRCYDRYRRKRVNLIHYKIHKTHHNLKTTDTSTAFNFSLYLLQWTMMVIVLPVGNPCFVRLRS